MLEEYQKAGKAGLGVVLRVPVLYGDAEVPAESAVNILLDNVWKAQESVSKIKMDHWALRYPTNGMLYIHMNASTLPSPMDRLFFSRSLSGILQPQLLRQLTYL